MTAKTPKAAEKAKPGRPHHQFPVRVTTRMTADLLEAIDRAARLDGRTRDGWIRATLERASRPDDDGPPPRRLPYTQPP